MFDNLINLQGSQFLTTYFSQFEQSVMILALGDNMNGEKMGPSLVYLYMCIDGEVDHGIESFAFSNVDEAWSFVDNLQYMSAIDFMAASIGCPPKIL